MEKTIQITAGRGPAECCWVVAQVLKLLLKEFLKQGIQHEIIDRKVGVENATLESVVLRCRGKDLNTFLKTWIGTIQWVGQSRFRKHHKRKNWFIAINELDAEAEEQLFREQDVSFEFVRASGPGGQHVNKVNTAVRATHLPTNCSVFSMKHRSQWQNRKEAISLLKQAVLYQHIQKQKEQLQEGWGNHTSLQRGNPVRVFKGNDFKNG